MSDDSAGRMESCDVMETGLLTDASKQASLSASAHHHSYPRCMSVNTNSHQNNSTSVAACLCVLDLGQKGAQMAIKIRKPEDLEYM